MRTGILLTAMAAFSYAVAGATGAPYSGKVFADRNGNGIFDKGDRPLAEVSVSDGLNVVKTDRNGDFSLPGHDKARFAFVTVPSGYKTDNAHYKRLGGEETSYDFALTPYGAGIRKDESHTFIQVTDTEISGTDGHGEWAGEVRRYAENSGAAFIIHTGDICYEKGLKSHIQLMNTGNMGIPVYYCIGNHDLVKGSYGEELFESIYGPSWYSFDVAGTHYVAFPMPNGDYKPSYTMEDVAAWLENDLANIKPGTPVVAFCHDLLTSGDSFMYGNVNLNAHNLKAWVYGHIHTNYNRQQGDVVTVCTSSTDKGGIDHSSGGFRVFTVAGSGDIKTELRYPYLDRKVTIASPAGISTTGSLIVNAYSTVSPVKSVSYDCLLEGKPVIKSVKTDRVTDWTWTAEMPLKKEWTKRSLTIKVKATFEDGSTAEDEAEFTYRPDGAAPGMSSDWTNLLGNASHTATADALDGEPVLAWATNIGGNIFMTSPVIYEGDVFTATTDEDMNGTSFICALDGSDGSILWKYATRGSVKNSIAADSGLVFAQDIYGYLYAVDAAEGTLAWETRLNVNDGLPPLLSGLAADKGTVYAGNGLGLAAFEATTGRKLWENKDWQQREGTATTVAAGDGIIVGGVQWMALYGNDAETGRMLWSHSENGLRDRGASAAIHGHLLYIISGKSLFIIDPRTGRIVVRKETPYNLQNTSTPLLTDKSIIFGTANDGIIALDRETLEEKWHSATGEALICTVPYSRPASRAVETSPVLAGSTVYIGASDGTVYGLDAGTGEKLWSHETGAPILSTVAVSGNTLIVTDFGGNVYAFSF